MNERGQSLAIFGIALLLFVGLSFTPLFQSAENRIYDAMLRTKPGVQEREDIVLLDIDDLAISEVGTWPWSRHRMAEGLVLLREFGAAFTVLDIEYVDQSPLAVDSTVLRNDVPNAVREQLAEIEKNVRDLLQAVAAGQLDPQSAVEFVQDIPGLHQEGRQELMDEIQQIARDNDVYLGNAARLNGSTYATVNLLVGEDPAVPEERKELAVEKEAIERIDPRAPESVADHPDIRPAIPPVIEGAAGLGFPNVIVDEDGVRRRINLVGRYDEHYFAQLVFRPLLDVLQNPNVVVERNRFILEDAVHPDEEEPRRIVIPRANDGSMLIHWPKATFIDSFRHISYYELVYHDEQLADLIHNLSIMEESGYLQYYEGDRDLLRAYDYAESIREDVLAGGDPEQAEEYQEVRTYFFEEAGNLLSGGAQETLLSELEAVLESEGLSEGQREELEALREEIPQVFESTAGIYENVMETRNTVEEAVAGSYVIIGFTGTGTTDIGVNPFEKEYMNVGTHAAIVNTILTEDFIDDTPWWYSGLVAAILGLAVALIIQKRSPQMSLIVGLVVILLTVGGSYLFFATAHTYFRVLPPTLTVLVTAVAISLLKFLAIGKEKNFIRNAFSHYLSNEVINEILTDPQMLALGGQKKELTALFTDVKGFSSISEKLDPHDLVKLLNRYLSEMSDIILQLKGTIDKYEGDAIICFFGAPLNFEDHPSKACLSAIRMKKMERYLNDHFLEEQISPSALYTRIGINTGEMIVGNMGTQNRMDYTIMGHSVNLAARLEGVNKQYGTWILMSQATYEQTDDKFEVRQLDRVRVVGVSEPVRLYELLDEKGTLDQETRNLCEGYTEAHGLFEERNWEEAQKRFSELAAMYPEDGPVKYYLERCKSFMKKPPAEDWDGVFNLTRK
ncbi:MAG: CHASE2 domain-containing protein [Spirochaetaceae bacterium]